MPVEVKTGSSRVQTVSGKVMEISENVRVCCEICNSILRDLPPEAKDLLASGLRSIREKRLLEDYIIPTKRNRTRR